MWCWQVTALKPSPPATSYTFALFSIQNIHPFLLNGKRFVKNAETRALTGLDVKPPTTIAAYVSAEP